MIMVWYEYAVVTLNGSGPRGSFLPIYRIGPMGGLWIPLEIESEHPILCCPLTMSETIALAQLAQPIIMLCLHLLQVMLALGLSKSMVATAYIDDIVEQRYASTLIKRR